MQLLSPEFFFLLALIMLLYWLPARPRQQNLLLLITSYTCYGFIHPWFMLLLAGVTVIAFGAGKLMCLRPSYRRSTLMLSSIGLTLILGLFKYAGQ